MKKARFFPLQVSLCTVCCLSASSGIAQAQITPDGTLNTQVNQNGNVAEITGGETRGGNLFHSFDNFSVPTALDAFFNNANGISNIFSRVTGGNISNIDGLIRANGSASLFLINPAGIIFGENARLDIGGSFYGSTASNILFEDGEFSAVDNLDQPILTVNTPIGLGFRDNPGDIINRSVVQNSAGNFAGLEIASGETLALIGGDINFEAGNATISGGQIEIGGLREIGTVLIENDGSLTFPENVARANLSFNSASLRGTEGSSISLYARDLELTNGARIDASTISQGSGGIISVNATDSISIDGTSSDGLFSSGIFSTALAGKGDGGSIDLVTNNLSITNGARIDTSTFDEGNGGIISVDAIDSISIDGTSSDGEFSSSISALVGETGVGNSGDINLMTNLLSLTNEGEINNSIQGQGDGGAINIQANEVNLTNGEISSEVDEGAIGDAGDLNFDVSQLFISDEAELNSSTSGEGNGGTIIIQANEVNLVNGEISSGSEFSSRGNAGDLDLTTDRLAISDGGVINGSSLGTGNGGFLSIQTNFLSLDQGFIVANVASGLGGNTQLLINNGLTLRNNSLISASAFDETDGGNLTIDSSFIVAFSNRLPGDGSDIIASAERGEGGNINIRVETVVLGIEERFAFAGNETNDIDASSDFALDGSVTVPNFFDFSFQETNLIESEKTTQQACEANRELAAKNGFNISGKGGIVPDPKLPLNSLNLYPQKESTSNPIIPAPIQTSKGKIQPARGIMQTESGEIILTAYRTNNSGDRITKTRYCS